MTTKLTLTLDKNVIERAKRYAKKHGRSLSSIVENHFKALSEEKEESYKDDKITPLVRSMRGAFELPDNFDYEKELTEALSKKYLKDD